MSLATLRAIQQPVLEARKIASNRHMDAVLARSLDIATWAEIERLLDKAAFACLDALMEQSELAEVE